MQKNLPMLPCEMASILSLKTFWNWTRRKYAHSYATWPKTKSTSNIPTKCLLSNIYMTFHENVWFILLQPCISWRQIGVVRHSILPWVSNTTEFYVMSLSWGPRKFFHDFTALGCKFQGKKVYLFTDFFYKKLETYMKAKTHHIGRPLPRVPPALFGNSLSVHRDSRTWTKTTITGIEI